MPTHVLHGTVITFAEAFSICIAEGLFHMRMTVRIVVICIRATAFMEVVARSFHAFMEAPPLGVIV